MKKIKIGYTTMTHGLKGEIKLFSYVSFKEKCLKKDFPVYIDHTLHHISSVRMHKNIYLVTFDYLNDINLVEEFRNKDIYIDIDDLELKEKEIIVELLIGYMVYNKEIYIGKVTDIMLQKNEYLLEIKGTKKIFIPYQKEFIQEIKKEEEKIICKNIDGLLEI